MSLSSAPAVGVAALQSATGAALIACVASPDPAAPTAGDDDSIRKSVAALTYIRRPTAASGATAVESNRATHANSENFAGRDPDNGPDMSAKPAVSAAALRSPRLNRHPAHAGRHRVRLHRARVVKRRDRGR